MMTIVVGLCKALTKHLYVKEHPRLINEILRYTNRYNYIKNMRSASERSKSIIKEDIKMLNKRC